MFLENMSLAFDKSAVVKEYKEKIEVLQKDKDSMVKKVGELTIEKDFLEGKSPRLKVINNDTNSNNFDKFYCIIKAS